MEPSWRLDQPQGPSSWVPLSVFQHPYMTTYIAWLCVWYHYSVWVGCVHMCMCTYRLRVCIL